VWPCFLTSGLLFTGFVRLERRIAALAGDPLFDLSVLARPGIAPGVCAVVVVMACYAGFFVSLSFHLQNGLRFGPLRAGATFVAYAGGFATASLTWARANTAIQNRLPVFGPLVMGVSLLGVGLIAADGRWPVASTAPLLFAGGVGHAWAFSPLTNRLTSAVRADQAADLSGLIMTASLVGQVIGIAAFVGIYLSVASHGSGHSLAIVTEALAAVLVVTATCGCRSLSAPVRPGGGERQVPRFTPRVRRRGCSGRSGRRHQDRRPA
jgi:hypothetical protein